MDNIVLIVPMALIIVVRHACHWYISRRRGRKYVVSRKGLPSVAIWFACYIGVLLLFLANSKQLSFGPVYLIGFFVLLVSTTIRVFAMSELSSMYDEFVVIKSSHVLISTGIYSIVRHPLHLGLVGEIAALSILSGEEYSAAFVAISLATYFVRNRSEDTALKQHFGDEYSDYVASLPMHRLWSSILRFLEQPVGPRSRADVIHRDQEI